MLLTCALTACGAPAAMDAPSPLPKGEAPAPATAPARAMAPSAATDATTDDAPEPWPDALAPLQDAVEHAWSLEVTGLAANTNGAFIEHEGTRRLCLFHAEGEDCYAWPDALPPVETVRVFRAEGGEVPGAGSALTLAEGEMSHHVELGKGGDALVLRHRGSVVSRTAEGGFDYTKPRRRASTALERHRAWWKHGRPKLDPTPPGAIAPLLRSLGALAATPLANLGHVRTVRHEPFTLWNVHREEMGEITDGLVCHREDGGAPRCLEARMTDALPLRPAATLPAAWLLLVDEPGYRSGATYLVWLDVRADVPTWASLPVGSMHGLGEACEHTDSYCVTMEGLHTPYVLVTPTCVRIEPSVAWRAVHVRARRRLIDRSEAPAPAGTEPRPGTYAPRDGAWIQAPCGTK